MSESICGLTQCWKCQLLHFKASVEQTINKWQLDEILDITGIVVKRFFNIVAQTILKNYLNLLAVNFCMIWWKITFLCFFPDIYERQE